MTLGVYWDRVRVGKLDLTGERTREYSFRYLDTQRPISLSLPTSTTSFTPAESRPFFEALLPEGAIREQIAATLKLAASDSYELLAELGRDCAGALQIIERERLSDLPSVRWLEPIELDQLIHELPQRPLGIAPGDRRVRLSLAGVQRKAVLVGDRAGRFGEPLDGMPSTHILKPQPPDDEYPDIAHNEFFCMRLAERCRLLAAKVELITADGRACLVVERFDRDISSSPVRRLHQEDLSQALGLTPDFKYQRPGWTVPSYASLAVLLDQHSLRPGVDRLAAAQAAVFNFLVANADAHAKNISLLHEPGGIRIAPLYDVACTGAYPELSTELALAIGDELDPSRVGAAQWSDLAFDFQLNPRAFERERQRLASAVPGEALKLLAQARGEGWHRPILEAIAELIAQRAQQL
ncbi:MAG: type II toxin-antitoxin system HipA family toxin [Actinomycetota bacterium]|nr:type II toxin-antitoxin system HipA family toxin [Actinomycetota bacterium]